MKYEQIYNLLNKVYEFKYKNKFEYFEFNNLYDSLINYHISGDEEYSNIILKSFYIKNLALNGITFNNLHLITDNSLFSNIFRCFIEKENYNKKKQYKPMTLHLYYDNDKFNYEELVKLEEFHNIFNKKIIYVYNYDLINDLLDFLINHNYEIVYLIKNKCELFGNKDKIQLKITDKNIKELKEYFKLISSMNTSIVYLSINSKNSNIINEYSLILKELKKEYPNILIINESYLLGEHLGIDENNKFYMKLNTTKFYPSVEKTFQDFYIEYNIITNKCLNCEEIIFCTTNTSNMFCEYKTLF